jgi:hypothetical protein
MTNTAVIADSGFWIALFNCNDEFHSPSVGLADTALVVLADELSTLTSLWRISVILALVAGKAATCFAICLWRSRVVGHIKRSRNLQAGRSRPISEAHVCVWWSL